MFHNIIVLAIDYSTSYTGFYFQCTSHKCSGVTMSSVSAIRDDKAGMKGQNLSIVLEPEAESFFRRYLPVEKLSDSGKCEISCFKPYIVVDTDGGTVDITVHEVLHDGHLRELLKKNGGPWGGTTIDEANKEFLESLCGQKTCARLQRDVKEYILNLIREFEIKKRTVSPELHQKVPLKIPITLHKAFQDYHKKSFFEVVTECQDLQGKLVFAVDKMPVEPILMTSIFQKICNTIVCHHKYMFGKLELSGVDKIQLVGGFSESLVIPSVVSRFTYGISVRKPAQNVYPKELLIQAPTIWKKIMKTFFMSNLITWENSSVAEKQVVQALRTATGRQAFSSQARKHLGLEFREAHNGSIIIRFCPKVGKSLQKVKQSCATGKIKAFLPSIFMQSGVEHTLGEGDFSWKFSIYRTCKPIYLSAQETASSVVRMVNEEDVIKDHWKLLEEELDPWILLGDLQMNGLVGEEDGDKMLKLDSRKDCVKFLLERLLASEEPDLGYEILLDHCREHNDYLYQKIQVTEGLLEFCGYVDKRSETERCQSEREMLFTATVILSIHRKEKTPKQYGSHMKLEISNLTIQAPICYFDIEAEAESDAADLQEEVVMVLEQVL